MTDVDRLLTEDGARWRSLQPAPPEPDLTRLARRHRPGWQPLAAAAAVSMVVAGGVALAATWRSPDPVAPAGDGAASPGDEVVRDGDRVVGQGFVVALPGRPVQLCTPSGGVRVDVYPEPVPEACPIAVTVTGLDLDRLSKRRERDGAVWGSARVEGVYRAGTLTVTRQEDFVEPPRADVTAPDRMPCPEPAAGWPRQPDDMSAALARLNQAVNRNAAEYNGPWVLYPYGWHLQDRSNRKGTEVYAVGTVGDVAAAERALREVFPAEQLCVTRVTWSKAAMDAAASRLRSPQARRVGIGTPFPDVLGDRVVAEMSVLDQAASQFLAGVTEGRVVAEPVLRKAG